MELDALHGKLPVPQSHDDASPIAVPSPGADLKIVRKSRLGDDQRVVASRGHWRSQVTEDRLAIMLDPAGLAVHKVLGANHLPAESSANCLVSQADTKQRNFAGEVPDQFDADASVLWGAGAGRNDNALGTHRFNVTNFYLIVAAHLNQRAQFADVLDQVVSKRIVVIEDEDHVLL